MSAAQHARVMDGEVAVKFDGRWIVSSFVAWREWLDAVGSPFRATQERAREIRAALDEVGYLREPA